MVGITINFQNKYVCTYVGRIFLEEFKFYFNVRIYSERDAEKVDEILAEFPELKS